MASLRDAAKGAPCFILLEGCAPGPGNEATMLCHHKGAGMAMKADDLNAVLGCNNCHTRLDGPEGDLPEPYDEIFERAKRLTHKFWRRKGLIDG